MYAAQADLEARFGSTELEQLAPAAGGGIDSARVDQALADAAAEIDGYLQSRYTLPLSAVPVVLTRICADLARYYLHDDAAPEIVSKRYEHAVAFLRGLADGKTSLGLSDAGQSAQVDNGAEIQSGGRVWDRADSTGYL